MKIKVLFIIIAYKPEIKSFLKITHALKDQDICIIDNTPNKQQVLKNYKFSDRVSILLQDTNIGYTKGANIGLKKALETGYDWAVILNDDITINQTQIKQYLYYLQTSTPAIIGQNTGSLDKKRWSTIFHEDKNLCLDNLSYVSGSGIAIHRNIIKKVGYFYEPYFMYYEDVEYSLSAKKHGFKISIIPVKTFIHHPTGLDKSQLILKQYYLSRNHLLFIERNAPINIKLREFIRVPKTLWEHNKNKNISAIMGIKDYFLRRFGRYGDII